ncbi:hypothetical protein K4K56_004003 [Colletotrichum sp. SAR 10_98]|nr:hypothetical protein K4K56_004003 [Colletotrichum sp. SAR 10_98]
MLQPPNNRMQVDDQDDLRYIMDMFQYHTAEMTAAKDNLKQMQLALEAKYSKLQKLHGIFQRYVRQNPGISIPEDLHFRGERELQVRTAGSADYEVYVLNADINQDEGGNLTLAGPHGHPNVGQTQRARSGSLPRARVFAHEMPRDEVDRLTALYENQSQSPPATLTDIHERAHAHAAAHAYNDDGESVQVAEAVEVPQAQAAEAVQVPQAAQPAEQAQIYENYGGISPGPTGRRRIEGHPGYYGFDVSQRQEELDASSYLGNWMRGLPPNDHLQAMAPPAADPLAWLRDNSPPQINSITRPSPDVRTLYSLERYPAREYTPNPPYPPTMTQESNQPMGSASTVDAFTGAQYEVFPEDPCMDLVRRLVATDGPPSEREIMERLNFPGDDADYTVAENFFETYYEENGVEDAFIKEEDTDGDDFFIKEEDLDGMDMEEVPIKEEDSDGSNIKDEETKDWFFEDRY